MAWLASYILKQQWWCLSVHLVGQGQEWWCRPSVCLRGRAGAVTLAFPGRYLLAGQGQGRAGGSSIFGDLEFALQVSKTQKDLGNFRQGRGILSFWRPGVCTPGFQDPKRPGKF